MNKLQLNLQPPHRSNLQSTPPQNTNTRRDYIMQIYDYFGWTVPQAWRPTATPAPVFSQPQATDLDLDNMPFKELAALAKERGISSFGVKKDDLIAQLKQATPSTPKVERIKVLK